MKGVEFDEGTVDNEQPTADGVAAWHIWGLESAGHVGNEGSREEEEEGSGIPQ